MSQLLEKAQREAELAELPLWIPVPDRDAIRRDFRFPDFRLAWSFMFGVALIAERQDHHPEWSNIYGTVSITLISHDRGGLTGRDIRMAHSIDRLHAQFAV